VVAGRVKKNIRKLKAYNPGLFNGKYKLDANENCYDIPMPVKRKILRKLQKVAVNRYPDPYGLELKEKLSKKLKVNKKNLFLGNGSDEIIYYLLQSFVEKGERIIVPVPTFEMYGILGIVSGAKVIEVPLTRDFDIDDKKIIKHAKSKRVKFIFIAYPNNPTGNCFSKSRILNIIKNTNSFIVIDEAYYEFSGKTFLGYREKYKNIIVLRTFSKAYSMAGLRVGYMIADQQIINVANKVKLPYNVNSISQFVAKEVLSFGGNIQAGICNIIKERERMCEEIGKYNDVVKSDANFLFVKIKNAKKAKKIFQKNKISIRMFKDGRIKNYMRLTIGKPEENRAVLRILRKGI